MQLADNKFAAKKCVNYFGKIGLIFDVKFMFIRLLGLL